MVMYNYTMGDMLMLPDLSSSILRRYRSRTRGLLRWSSVSLPRMKFQRVSQAVGDTRITDVRLSVSGYGRADPNGETEIAAYFVIKRKI